MRDLRHLYNETDRNIQVMFNADFEAFCFVANCISSAQDYGSLLLTLIVFLIALK